MKANFKTRLIAAVVAIGSTVGAFASGATPTVPTPDYTTFYAVVGVGLAVTLIVSLARKAKGFLR